MLAAYILLFSRLAGITDGSESISRTSHVLESNSTIHSECGAGNKSIIYNVSLTGWRNTEHVMKQMVGYLNYRCKLKQSCVIHGTKVNETYQKYTPGQWQMRVDILCVRSTNIITDCHHDPVIDGTGVIASYGYPYYSGNATDCRVRLHAEGQVQLTVATCGRISVFYADGQLCTGKGPTARKVTFDNSTLTISYELQAYGYSGFLFVYEADLKGVRTKTSFPTPNTTKKGYQKQNLWWIVLAVLLITVGGWGFAATIFLIKRRSKESRGATLTPDDHEYDYITMDELLDMPVISPEISAARKADVVRTPNIITSQVTDDELENDEISKGTSQNDDVNRRIYHVLDPSAVKFPFDSDST